MLRGWLSVVVSVDVINNKDPQSLSRANKRNQPIFGHSTEESDKIIHITEVSWHDYKSDATTP